MPDGCDIGFVRCRRAALEHGRAGDQHIGAGLATSGAVSGVMPPSISMSMGRAADQRASRARILSTTAGNEGLAAEARIDRHHQDEVDEVDARIRCALTGVPGLIETPAFLPSARIACSERCEMRAGLGMHGDDVGTRPWRRPRDRDRRARSSDARRAASWCAARIAFDHVRADGDVGHEMPVHHVDMDPVGAGGIDGADLLAERRNRRTGSTAR